MIVAYISNADDVIAEVECEGDEIDDNCPSGWVIKKRLVEPCGDVIIIVEADED